MGLPDGHRAVKGCAAGCRDPPGHLQPWSHPKLLPDPSASAPGELGPGGCSGTGGWARAQEGARWWRGSAAHTALVIVGSPRAGAPRQRCLQGDLAHFFLGGGIYLCAGLLSLVGIKLPAPGTAGVLACLGTQPGTAPWGWGGGAGGCPYGDSHGRHLCPHGDTLRHTARWPLGTGGAEPTLPPCCLTLPLPVPPYQHLRGGTTDSERSRVMHAPCAGWHCRGARCQPPPHGRDLLPAALLLPRAGSVPPQNPQNPAGGSILPREVCVGGKLRHGKRAGAKVSY